MGYHEYDLQPTSPMEIALSDYYASMRNITEVHNSNAESMVSQYRQGVDDLLRMPGGYDSTSNSPTSGMPVALDFLLTTSRAVGEHLRDSPPVKVYEDAVASASGPIVGALTLAGRQGYNAAVDTIREAGQRSDITGVAALIKHSDVSDRVTDILSELAPDDQRGVMALLDFGIVDFVLKRNPSRQAAELAMAHLSDEAVKNALAARLDGSRYDDFREGVINKRYDFTDPQVRRLVLGDDPSSPVLRLMSVGQDVYVWFLAQGVADNDNPSNGGHSERTEVCGQILKQYSSNIDACKLMALMIGTVLPDGIRDPEKTRLVTTVQRELSAQAVRS